MDFVAPTYVLVWNQEKQFGNYRQWALESSFCFTLIIYPVAKVLGWRRIPDSVRTELLPVLEFSRVV